MKKSQFVESFDAVLCGDLTRTEVCRICRVDADQVEAMVSEGVIDTLSVSDDEPRFSEHAVWRIRVALRLQRDLAVNLAGAALALDLLEEIERLRLRVGNTR